MIQFYTEQQLEKHEKLNIDVDDALTIQQQQQQQKGEQIKQQEKLDNNYNNNNNTSSLLIIIIRGKELRKREIIRNKKNALTRVTEVE